MRALFLLLSAAWIALAFYINEIITAQGKLIGGRSLFDHMGMGSALAAQNTLIAVSLAVGAWLVILSIKKHGSRSLLFYISVATLCLVVITYFHPRISFNLPIIVHRVVGSIFVGHYVFPHEFTWVKYFALSLSVLTAATLKIPSKPN